MFHGTPWKFERQKVYEDHAKATGKTLEDHIGYIRDNDGSWGILNNEGGRACTVPFHGKAKRGERWNAPDPEGMEIARLIVRAVNSYVDESKSLEAGD